MRRMSESEPETPSVITEDPVIPAPPAATPAPARRRGTPWAALAALVLLAGLAALAYWLWHTRELENGQQKLAQADLQKVDARVAALTRSAEQAQREVEALRAQLDDGNKVNQSLREQLLGLSERARLVEDAIASLADKRLTGHDTMLLDEAEMLLALGAERYQLFHDPAATIAAYRSADNVLAALEDPAFSTVRQSISAEIEALTQLTSANVESTSGSLSALRGGVAELPAARREPGAAAGGAQSSHWWNVFGDVVRVRTGDDTAALLQRHDAALARQLLVLDLREVEAALLARDQTRYTAAIDEALAELKRDFDAEAATVKEARATLEGLAKLPLAPAPPGVFGVALKELRNLRATHALRAPAPASGTPDSPPEARQ
jgi:uroporphyrin-3 C-methyltransferase